MKENPSSLRIRYKKKDFSTRVLPFFFDKKNQPAIYLFEGMLGSGKTFMIKEVLRELYNINTSSPTFSYFKKFNLENENLEIFHFDLYRLKEGSAFWENGFLEDILNPRSTCFIEWPMILESNFFLLSLSKPVYFIKFNPCFDSGSVRDVEIFFLQPV